MCRRPSPTHTSLRFAEANETYQRAFAPSTPPASRVATEQLRVGTSLLPNDLDSKTAIVWPNIHAAFLASAAPTLYAFFCTPSAQPRTPA